MPSFAQRFLWIAALPLSVSLGAETSIDFNRDIRPILSENCYFCHGPDEADRKADLRLDIPGGFEKDELIRRVHESDADEIMPPPKSKLALTAKQKSLLKQWIKEGGEYDALWSFVAPKKAELPELPNNLKSWSRNAIDSFVASRLIQENLKPSDQATKETLIRRASLDLTGLPPTPREVDAFLADKSANAYEKVIDRLLNSERYGERMALVWLDAARYADTGGYQGDLKKTQWPWRDWVIDAYNKNMPFDQFTIEQLAGDLLPNPTDEQRLATAFNRNHRINDEGGIIPEEFLVEYVADRVETTSTVWMGLTVGCARCHDHKYDPISQQDFYELFAFFNNVPEQGKDGDLAPKPNMDVYTGGTKAEHEALKKQLSELEAKKRGYAKAHAEAFSKWNAQTAEVVKKIPEFASLPAPLVHLSFDEVNGNQTQNLGANTKPAVIRGVKGRVVSNQTGKHHFGVSVRQGGFLDLGKMKGYKPEQALSFAAWVQPTRDIGGVEGPVFSSVSPDKKRQGFHVNLVEREAGEKTFAVAFRLHADRTAGKGIEVVSTETIPWKKMGHIAVAYDGSKKASGVRLFINGKESPVTIGNDSFEGTFVSSEELLVGAETESSSDKGIRDELLASVYVDDARVYDSALTNAQIGAIFSLDPAQILAARSNRSQQENGFLSRSYFRDHDPEYKKLAADFNKAAGAVKAFESQKITAVSIMEEMPKPRVTYLLQRGVYDQPDKTKKLAPATLHSLPPMPNDLPKNRRGLAEWLLRPENPLTARVAVNRYWQMYFGTGLVKTPEDFGSQGQLPTHPALLDWLAVEFRESGWDVKAMQKLIVMSATYRQSSIVNSDLRERDPENRLLARGPRFRLYGQALRDQALAVSGQLDSEIGGAPVMPYQPEGLWEEVSAKGVKYIVADGKNLYRRSLYTFWRRTVPPPSMMNFDNSTRENCSVISTRTNTPLQAMNLLNDPQYVEAARLLAARMIQEGGKSATEQIQHGHKLVLAREPDESVLKILTSGFDDYLENYKANPEEATALLSVGKTKSDATLNPPELAAMTAVASVILNLDETVTKE